LGKFSNFGNLKIIEFATKIKNKKLHKTKLLPMSRTEGTKMLGRLGRRVYYVRFL
jgi:hypothetical protein